MGLIYLLSINIYMLIRFLVYLVLYRTKLWQGENLANSPSFFANIPDEAHGHAVCVMNVIHVK